MWHEYTRNYRVKHWDDHGVKSDTKKTSGERDVFARNKTRQLFGTQDYGIDMGIYGLGTARSVHDYEVYGGFDFKKLLYSLKKRRNPFLPPYTPSPEKPKVIQDIRTVIYRRFFLLNFLVALFIFNNPINYMVFTS